LLPPPVVVVAALLLVLAVEPVLSLPHDRRRTLWTSCFGWESWRSPTSQTDQSCGPPVKCCSCHTGSSRDHCFCGPRSQLRHGCTSWMPDST
jgi:hypothetical protein